VASSYSLPVVPVSPDLPSLSALNSIALPAPPHATSHLWVHAATVELSTFWFELGISAWVCQETP
jgi:hypothetical protein